jgi:hypothetical protein
MAAVDAFEPTILVTGAWWLVLLLVWLMPWPDRGFDSTTSCRLNWNALHQLTTLGVFSWLLFRANTAVLEAVSTWELFDAHNAVYRFSYLLQNTVVGLAAALLFIRPLHRIFGRAAVQAAFLVATPWIVLTCAGTAFDLHRWVTDPAGTYLWLFEAIFPALLLMVACERRTGRLHSGEAPHTPTWRTALQLFVRGQTGLGRTVLAFLLALAVAIGVLRSEIELPEPLLVAIPVFDQARELALTICTLLLTFTTVALVRALRGREFRIGRLKLYGSGSEWALAFLLLSPAWLVTIFHSAPVIGASTIDTIQRLPDPFWIIHYDTSARTIHLSGGYGPGVAADFADRLAAHHDVVAVELTGPGGRLGEGMRIAELIEERNLTTIVRERCASACTFAFAGGRERIVEGAGRLGFHASSSPSVLLEWLKDTDFEDAFLQQRGVDAEFIARANAVPSNDIWYPPHDELKAAGVITAVR